VHGSTVAHRYKTTINAIDFRNKRLYFVHDTWPDMIGSFRIHWPLILLGGWLLLWLALSKHARTS
jgi:hypothetical protein